MEKNIKKEKKEGKKYNKDGRMDKKLNIEKCFVKALRQCLENVWQMNRKESINFPGKR